MGFQRRLVLRKNWPNGVKQRVEMVNGYVDRITIRKILLFTFLILTPQVALRDDFRVASYLGTQGFFIPYAQSPGTTLNPSIGVETRFEIAYSFGATNGPIIGL